MQPNNNWNEQKFYQNGNETAFPFPASSQYCKCGLPDVLNVCKKGENQGRYFYSCAKNNTDPSKCSHWKSADGYPFKPTHLKQEVHTNPFVQQLPMQVSTPVSQAPTPPFPPANTPISYVSDSGIERGEIAEQLLQSRRFNELLYMQFKTMNEERKQEKKRMAEVIESSTVRTDLLESQIQFLRDELASLRQVVKSSNPSSVESEKANNNRDILRTAGAYALSDLTQPNPNNVSNKENIPPKRLRSRPPPSFNFIHEDNDDLDSLLNE